MIQDRSLDSPEEVRGLIRAGRAAIRVGDYEAARTTFERAVSLDPANQDALDGLHDAQRRLGVTAQERSADAVEYCYRHPETETGLHCVQCGRPICVRCSHPAAVGQLCPDCRRGRRAPNYQLSSGSLIKGATVAFVVSAIASVVVGRIPFFFMLFLGPAAGELVMRTVDWATRNKRGRALQLVVSIALAAGAAAAVVSGYASLLSLSLWIYLVLAIGTASARLR